MRRPLSVETVVLGDARPPAPRGELIAEAAR
jgi:hypothetical protein